MDHPGGIACPLPITPWEGRGAPGSVHKRRIQSGRHFTSVILIICENILYSIINLSLSNVDESAGDPLLRPISLMASMRRSERGG